MAGPPLHSEPVFSFLYCVQAAYGNEWAANVLSHENSMWFIVVMQRTAKRNSVNEPSVISPASLCRYRAL